MCCFAGSVVPHVSNTRIFARTFMGEATLVYSLELSVKDTVAMILPVPIAPEAGSVAEDALRFVNLEGYPKFFDDLERGFPRPLAARGGFGFAPQAAAMLAVQTVGAFEASFVPNVEAFARLDPRFVLAPDVWQSLPHYRDYGFAVFRLSPGTNKHVHPMAFRFPTRFVDHVFFPTVHVHDGHVHETASFDHALYYQVERPLRGNEISSTGAAASFMDPEKALGLVELGLPVGKMELRGSFQNSDYFVQHRS